ncbi:MAG: GHKL domain-containing protein [Clostridia bacterium]|nr:GHKL domain-containing protein [Clostridia bacterium]
MLDYIFLYVFGVAEVLAYGYYFRGVPRRFRGNLKNGLIFIGIASALFLWSFLSLTSGQTRDVYSYVYVAEYYLTLILFGWLFFAMPLTDVSLNVIIILLCTRGIRHTLGHIMIIINDTNYLVEGSAWIYRFLSILLLSAMYLVVFYAVRRVAPPSGRPKVTGLHLLLGIAAAAPVIYVGAFAENLALDGSWSRGLDAILIEDVVSISGLFCMLGYGWMLENQKKNDDIMNLEHRMELMHRQYEVKKELIDGANRKYHDMKNHLILLDGDECEKSREEYIRELSEELDERDTVYETGNETLDIILLEKGHLCRKKNILFVVMVDGGLLGFMRPTDITSIFGNALDNAIEHVEQIGDPAKRKITLKISRRGNWLAIHIENACELSRLSTADGELLTSKSDLELHGFGLPSIRYSVERYGGNATTNAEAGIFSLDIIIPDGSGIFG